MQLPLYVGDYVLGAQDGQWGWMRLTAASTLSPFDVYAQLDSKEAFISLGLTATGIVDVTADETSDVAYYDLQGRRIKSLAEVQKGQVVIVRKGGVVKKIVM